MENQLKERLVGAVVLVLAAVLFIPMILDGPGSDRQVSQPIALPDTEQNRRTVRIDLAGGDADKAAPTVESLPEAPADEPVSIDLTPSQEAEPAQEPPAVSLSPNDRRPTSREPAAFPEPGVSKPAGDAPWTVQVGSFSQDENAEALAGKLRELGYPAYVSRFNDGNRVHFRVRVGGFDSRDAAEKRAREINGRTGEPARPVPSS